MLPRERLKTTEETKIYRRHLPHIEEPGSAYFVTFKTIDEVILSEEAKNVVLESINFHAGKKYRLFACVVMDTHTHVIIQPLEQSKNRYYSLAQIFHSIKSYSAHQINKLLNQKGTIWQNENYDRIIRDDKDYLEKVNYILNNHVEIGQVQRPEDYRWLLLNNSDDKLRW